MSVHVPSGAIFSAMNKIDDDKRGYKNINAGFATAKGLKQDF